MSQYLDLIIANLPSQETATSFMKVLIDAHAREFREEPLAPLRTLQYDSEIEALKDLWFLPLLSEEPPVEKKVAGLWFGIFQPIREVEGSQDTIIANDFYFSGSDEFEVDPTGDWACSAIDTYWPENRYAGSGVLKAIYNSVVGNGQIIAEDQYLCVGYVAYAAKTFLSAASSEFLCRPGERVGVAVGWDSGDPLYLGYVTERGFELDVQSPELEL